MLGQNVTRLEALLWSIALPGFGQLLNKKHIKGILFIVLEFLINMGANFNEGIRLSFLGETRQSLEVMNIQWLMFYPCLYFFAIWDAFKEAENGASRFTFIPFVSCAYFVTVGIMYSSVTTINGVFIGPIWLPMLSVIPGLVVGLIVKKLLEVYIHKKK
jgi:hypothetical protein